MTVGERGDRMTQTFSLLSDFFPPAYREMGAYFTWTAALAP